MRIIRDDNLTKLCFLHPAVLIPRSRISRFNWAATVQFLIIIIIACHKVTLSTMTAMESVPVGEVTQTNALL